MAAEVASMTNGYAPHNGFGGMDNSSNAYNPTPASQQSMYPQPPAQEMASSTSTQSDIPKDEVGWYFVEQYYTTLSRSPEKLYLFYNKRSQFVSGQETDKVPVCVGQRAINDRIKELDFQDCKVRVTNVDSQASDNNIVIQVIGEISNKSQPHKKFTQTFVLATQTNGYFVLNDIFRYLVEEEDEETEQRQSAPQAEEEIQQQPAAESGHQEPPPTAADSGRETLTSSDNPAAIEHDASEVDEKLEETLAKPEEAAEPTVNGESHEQAEVDKEAAPEAAAESSVPEPEVNGETVAPAATEEVVQEEKPQAPTPSPAPTTATQTPAPSAAPPKPAVPKTWASLAASAARTAPAPVVPQAPSQPRQAAPKQQTQASAQAQTQAPASTPAAAATSTPSAPAREETSTPTSQDEWTAVGSSHNRSQSRQVEQQQQGPQSRGYIKNVQEHVKPEELRAHLEQFGELIYFDISRQKTSAFVDFKTPQGYQAAVAANPHNVCDSTLFVEERRVRPTNMPFGPRGGHNGQMQRGRGGPNQGPPRGAFNGGRGRGDFAPRGRGGAPRGRGGPAQA